jgi:hypothetical protein
MSVKAQAPPGRPARFDSPVADRGPIRFFTPEQMLQFAARMEELSASGKLAKLKPETANLCARAPRLLISSGRSSISLPYREV